MIKNAIKSVVEGLGYKILKISKMKVPPNPYADMKRLVNNKREPVVFDVGANVGQSINRIREYLPEAKIYSFEPGPSSFKTLSEKYQNQPGIQLENLALGSEITQKEFMENECTDMSSFLEIDRLGWGGTKKTVVNTTTLDNYCQTHGITHIDILKSDTQGFELEVFKGGLNMIKSNNIRLIYFEFIFSEMYKGLPGFDQIYRLLTENGFRPVNFYEFYYQEDLLSWADMLFVNKNYIDRS